MKQWRGEAVTYGPGWDILFISSVGYCEIHYDRGQGCEDMELNRGNAKQVKPGRGVYSVVFIVHP